MRNYVGATVTFANRCADLANMNPRDDLSTSTYCLAKPGREYIVFNPGSSSFTVSGLNTGWQYLYEWFDTDTYSVVGKGEVTPSGSSHTFSSPCSDAVLYFYFQIEEIINIQSKDNA
jgi:hypothetical protein